MYYWLSEISMFAGMELAAFPDYESAEEGRDDKSTQHMKET